MVEGGDSGKAPEVTCQHEALPTLVEEMVMREPAGPLRGWRCYRIEYGSECGCPEGRVWLPATINPDALEFALRSMCRQREAVT